MTVKIDGAPWRVSLRETLIGVAFFAVMTTALVNASTIWVAVMTTVCVILYLSAASVALASEGERRAAAIGFIVWGVTYLIVGWLIIRPHGDGPLATSWALWHLHGYIARELPAVAQPDGFGTVGSGIRGYFPDQDSFRRVGEIEWSWFFAVFGGFMTRGLFRCWRRPE